MLQIPIFHVNGEDPEAVAQVVSLAMDFRREFQEMSLSTCTVFGVVVIMKQMSPHLRSRHSTVIEQQPSVHESYLEKLLTLGEVSGRGDEDRRRTSGSSGCGTVCCKTR